MILKAIPYILISMASLTGGFFVGSNRATKTAEAMIIPCNCPPAAVVELAPDFDVSKINNKKGTFEYAPTTTFTNVQIVIQAKDTALFFKMLKEAK